MARDGAQCPVFKDGTRGEHAVWKKPLIVAQGARGPKLLIRLLWFYKVFFGQEQKILSTIANPTATY